MNRSDLDWPSAHASIGLSRIHYPVTALGYGTRVGVWFQGCSIRCRGCVSMDTWDGDPANQVPVADVLRAFGSLNPLDGMTVSGGEPFDQPEGLYQLLSGFRNMNGDGNTDVLVFSGYRHERLSKRYPHILKFIDTLISGPYIQGNPGDLTRGSGNQVALHLTELGQARYEKWLRSGKQAQVTVVGGAIWMIGIPQDSDLERLEAGLLTRGIMLNDASWRC